MSKPKAKAKKPALPCTIAICMPCYRKKHRRGSPPQFTRAIPQACRLCNKPVKKWTQVSAVQTATGRIVAGSW